MQLSQLHFIGANVDETRNHMWYVQTMIKKLNNETENDYQGSVLPVKLKKYKTTDSEDKIGLCSR